MTGGRVTGRLIAYLKDIEPDGGTIPTCDLIICRKYPKLYSQTIENSNGKTTAQTTTLTCAEEETARQDWERRNESRMEKVSERRQRGANDDNEERTTTTRSEATSYKQRIGLFRGALL